MINQIFCIPHKIKYRIIAMLKPVQTFLCQFRHMA